MLKVREIIRLPKITSLPPTPAFFRGGINRRGRVIPGIDLRVKFGVSAELAERTCLVVVQVKLPTAQIVQLGLIVDRVEAVATLAANAIEPAPDFGARVSPDYLVVRAKVRGAVKTRRDLDRVVAPDLRRRPCRRAERGAGGAGRPALPRR